MLRWITIVVICVSPVLRLALGSYGVDLYSYTFSRLDGLMAGALLALVSRSPGFNPRRFTNIAWAVFIVALPLAFLTVQSQWIVYSFSAAASVALLYVALYSGPRLLQQALRNRFLVFSGTISYGLYLLHKIPFNVGTVMGLTQYPAITGPLLLAVCYGIATLSWIFLERPFLKLKRFFESKPRASSLSVAAR
jgi:peptidoglycan/LPS O-acetylase OafA/YrhL